MGTKLDMGEREVESAELTEYCQNNGMSCFETSAKENIGIDEAFEKIIKLAAEYHNEDFEPAMPLPINPHQNR